MRKPIAIGLGILTVGFFLWWILGLWESKYLAEAKAKEDAAAQALAEKDKAEAAAKLEREAHEEERKQWAEQQAAFARSVAARNQQTDRLIAAAMAPKSSEDVGKEAEKELGIKPTATPTGFQISVQEMQEFVALKLDRDRLAANLKETERQ